MWTFFNSKPYKPNWWDKNLYWENHMIFSHSLITEEKNWLYIYNNVVCNIFYNIFSQPFIILIVLLHMFLSLFFLSYLFPLLFKILYNNIILLTFFFHICISHLNITSFLFLDLKLLTSKDTTQNTIKKYGLTPTLISLLEEMLVILYKHHLEVFLSSLLKGTIGSYVKEKNKN